MSEGQRPYFDALYARSDDPYELRYRWYESRKRDVLLAALPLILNLYTLSPASRELATQLIFIHDGFAMLLWPLALSMPNALRAANDVKFTMVLSIGSMVCFRIALSYVVGVRMGYGALGVWFAMLVDWAVRAAVYTWRFEKGKWESMARI